MFLVPINYLAIFFCAVAAMVIGFLWYGPLFGKQWMKLMGINEKNVSKARNDMTKTYTIMFISSLVMAYALAHFIWFTAPGSATLLVGVKTALWAWIGFIATSNLSKYLFSPQGKSLTLLYIDSGYYLVTLVVMAIILVSLP